jgi:hypothetical protein
MKWVRIVLNTCSVLAWLQGEFQKQRAVNTMVHVRYVVEKTVSQYGLMIQTAKMASSYAVNATLRAI